MTMRNTEVEDYKKQQLIIFFVMLMGFEADTETFYEAKNQIL